ERTITRRKRANGTGTVIKLKNGRYQAIPQGQRADELIAEGGFAGTRIGGAAVCESFPNLILTSDGCACDDVKRLLTLIETQTNERFHVKLERELKFW
ncbi:MAG: hypothetical protein II622_03745, partial [Thermoguttaceae bacterium]|nr:hypothetical protein [Thermoguttaceae bacterium]